MRKLFFCLKVFALFVVWSLVGAEDAPPAEEGPVTVESLISKGDAALKASDYEGALQNYSSAIKMDPNNFNTYYKRAGLYLLRGRNKPALDDLNKVLSFSPNFLQARLRRGKVYLAFGNMDAAKEDFSEVLKTKPDHDLALNQLKALEKCSQDLEMGREAMDSGRFEDANRALMKQRSGNVEALYLRGKAFYLIGEREAAIKHFQEGLKSDPENTACKSEFKRLSRLQKAMTLGEEKLTQEKFNEALELKDVEKTLETCGKAIEWDESLKAEAYMLAEDYDKAIREWQKAREKQPQNPQVNEGFQRAQRLQKMASRKDYYKILEVTKTATDTEIRKAHRKLALIWHPDKHDGPDKEAAEKKYVDIAEAYEVLSNPDTRARFDNGEDLNVQPNFGGGGFPFPQGNGPFTFSFNFGGR